MIFQNQMKNLSLALILGTLAAFVASCSSNETTPAPSPSPGSSSSSGSLYVTGSCDNTDGATIPGYWKNGVWTDFTGIDSTVGGYVTGLVISGSDLYASGGTSGTPNKAGYWKNGTWVPLANGEDPSPTTDKDAGASSIVVSENNVYVSGTSYNSDGLEKAGFWKNGSWTGYPNPESSSEPVYNVSIQVSGGIVYLSGNAAFEMTPRPGIWKDGVWTRLTNQEAQQDTNTAWANTLAVSGTTTYAGGYSDNGSNPVNGGTANVKIAGYWQGSTWHPLVNGLAKDQNGKSTQDAYVNSIVVSGSDVYSAGYVVNSNSDSLPGYWKNTTWMALPVPTGAEGQVNSIFVSGSDVYAAGYVRGTDDKYVPGVWKNGVWSALPTSAMAGGHCDFEESAAAQNIVFVP